MGLRILSLQSPGWGSPASEDIANNLHWLAEWTDAELSATPADLVVLPELSTTPYFCCRRDDRYFQWAEPIPGPATERFAEVARKHRASIVLPLFERTIDGHFHNAAAVIGSDGRLITGSAANGPVMPYRKCHVPCIENPPDTEAWEDYFFRPGAGLAVFATDKAMVGVLICFDRWFPEAWRMLLAQGAQIVAVPMVAWGFVEMTYMAMLQSRAVENGMFVVSCNRAGVETLDGVRMDHFGRSVILAPDGTVVTGALPGETQKAIFAEVDLEAIARQRELMPLLRNRRVDLYGEPRQWIQGV